MHREFKARNLLDRHRWRVPSLPLFSFLLLISIVALGIAQEANKPPGKRYRQPAIIEFEGFIGKLNEHYFYRKLEQARAAGADLVIVEIDSPGGRVDSSFQLGGRLRDVDWAHTVAFIPKEALSGAAIMSLGCDDIIMGDSAVLGDAGPIFLDEGFMFQHVPEKIRSDLATKIRNLAEAKGRSPALAEAMVNDELIVYQVNDRDTGETVYMTDAELDAEQDPKRWEKGKPVLESRADNFFEVDGLRAVELQLAQGNAASRRELAEVYKSENEPLVYRWSGLDTTVLVLNNSFVTGLLIVIGLIALFIEVSSPGIGVGGLVAGLCFSLFFWSRFLGGTAVWLEVVLFVAGVLFLLVEIFVLPGFGIAGLTGLLLVISSLLLAGQSFVIPRGPEQVKSLVNSLMVICGSGVIALVGCALIVRQLGNIPMLNRLALEPPAPDSVAPTGPQGLTSAGTGIALKVGDRGTARSALRPAGQCRFGDRKADVIADGAFIEVGTEVEIIDVSSNRIMVQAVG